MMGSDLPGPGSYVRDFEIWILEGDAGVEEVAGAVFPEVVLEV